MKLSHLLGLTTIGSLAGALPNATPQDAETAVADLTADIRDQALQQVDNQAARLRARGLEATCTREKLYFRKE